MFLLVGGLALSFLVAQYHSTKHVLHAEESRKNIPREELFWNNSVRNRIDILLTLKMDMVYRNKPRADAATQFVNIVTPK
jgi:hypothetical protein